MYRQAAQSWPHHDSCRPQKPSQNQRSVRREDVLDHAGTALHTHTHTHTHTHRERDTHTHTHREMSTCTPLTSNSQKSEQDKQEVTHRIRDLLQEAAVWTGVTHKQLNRSNDATTLELKHKHTCQTTCVCVCEGECECV